MRARGGSEPNFKEAKAEQRLSRISMGAIAAEFQWELSFLEQKQQACLFLFFVGASQRGTCGSAQSSSPSMPFVQGFQIELYWIVLCECPLRSMETQMGVLIWENPVFVLQDTSSARVIVPPLVE